MPELLETLKTNTTSPNLLSPMNSFELAQRNLADARADYQTFEQVAKNSPLNGLLVNPLDHEQTK
jgi:hypothetical protein